MSYVQALGGTHNLIIRYEEITPDYVIKVMSARAISGNVDFIIFWSLTNTKNWYCSFNSRAQNSANMNHQKEISQLKVENEALKIRTLDNWDELA